MASLRRAHHVVRDRAAKCGMRAATSPTLNTSVKHKSRGGGRATSQGCGLPPQGCKGGVHFSNRHMSNSN
jgi:hypothetical protein